MVDIVASFTIKKLRADGNGPEVERLQYRIGDEKADRHGGCRGSSSGGVHLIALAPITRLRRGARLISAVAQPFSLFGPLTKRLPRT